MRKNFIWGALSGLCIMMVVLDNKNALAGGVAGIELCLKTVIPALLPFFFLTGIITNTLQKPLQKLFVPIGKLFRIPKGAEYVLVLSLLGGYPIGAKAVSNLYRSGGINKKSAQRMLAFCNNPGPAFIFGMVGCLFDSLFVPWIIWGIIIFCDLVTATLLPSSSQISIHPFAKQNTSVLEDSIKAITKVCAWVIIFRVILSVLHRWIFWMLPEKIEILASGIFELANGCTTLANAEDTVFQFCSICTLLIFGGLCVTMQTSSVAGNLMGRQYWLGKLFQSCLSIPISYYAAILLFSQSITIFGIIIVFISTSIAITLGFILHKNNTGKIETDDI